MQKPYSFTVALYGAEVAISRTKLGWVGLTQINAPTGSAGALLEVSPGSYVIGWFDGRLSTLVHECTHCAEAILRHVGVPVRGEQLAYLTEHLFTQARKRA